MISNSRTENSRSMQSVRSQDNSLASSYPSLNRQPSLDSTAALISANPTGARSKCGTTPSPHGLKGQIPLTQPSPTVNTKEAMAVMQQLWSKPVGEEDTEPQPLSNLRKSTPFEIYTDKEEEPAAPKPPPFEIFTDGPEPSKSSSQPFQII